MGTNHRHTIPLTQALLSCVQQWNELAMHLTEILRWTTLRGTFCTPLICYSCTFNTVLGLLLVPHGQALSSSQHSGGPCDGCYSHSLSCQQASKEPVHPERVGMQGFAYRPTPPGPPFNIFHFLVPDFLGFSGSSCGQSDPSPSRAGISGFFDSTDAGADSQPPLTQSYDPGAGTCCSWWPSP